MKQQFLYENMLVNPLRFRVNEMMEPSISQASAEITHEALLGYVAKEQDKDAFARLFTHFAPRIKSYLMKGGASQDQADELAQETMLAVWDKADKYNPDKAAASTWIFTIARNKRIDALRRMKRPDYEPEDPALVADDMPHADERIGTEQEAGILETALETLPKEQAELLYKSFFEDKTHSDIAAETKIPLGTVKSRIRLALERLRGQNAVKALGK